ncbi:MAG: S8 family serine peptidase [Microbacterium sp.]|uniref:S8 family serine peptidase n=1 Tax=Microbacterium sp. TaxID=51671 RepID=UPI0039E38DC5
MSILSGAFVDRASAVEDTNWWYDAYHLGDAHDAGWTGEGVRIAVIDGQIDPDSPGLVGADVTVDDDPLCPGQQVVQTDPTVTSVHGTTVTSYLVGNGDGPSGIHGVAPDASVTFYGYGVDGNEDCAGAVDTVTAGPDQEELDISAAAVGILRAIEDGAQIINVSAASGSTYGDSWVIAEAIARGVVIVASMTNDITAEPIGEVAGFPYTYQGVVSVNAIDADGNFQKTSIGNTDSTDRDTTVVAAGIRMAAVGVEGDWDATPSMNGTSYATPIVTGMIALTAQKYPDATGNQLIQSLIRNTGTEEHELSHDDEYGYGAASATHMLQNDPTQYDDVNPLTDKVLSSAPTQEQVDFVAAALQQNDGERSAETAAAISDTASPWIWLLAVGGPVLLVGAASVVVLLRVKRRRAAVRA